MSADGLRLAVTERIQKEADDCANGLVNIGLGVSVEAIALRVAYLKGAAEACGRAMNALDEEYRKLMAPDHAPEKAKTRELY